MNAAQRPGQFVVSLDFELHWGVRDCRSLSASRECLLGVQGAVPALLERFARREIHATWATVGLVFARTRQEALAHAPTRRPAYRNPRFDPYPDLAQAGVDERADPFHFAGSLVEQVARTPGQELGTHTYSHYYCLEPGHTAAALGDDLSACRAIGQRLGPVTSSLVFPRNQFDDAALAVVKEHGTVAFRGNPPAWFWGPRADGEETLPQRALRFADAYANVSQAPVARVTRHPSGLVNVPATRFLRPWIRRLERFDGRRLARIASEMGRAAEEGGLFHLWWHPENFGLNTERNLAFLDQVLAVYDGLRTRFGMQSMTMGEAAAVVA